MSFAELDRAVIGILFRLGSPTQEQIATSIGVGTAAIARSLTRLERQGVIDLVRDSKSAVTCGRTDGRHFRPHLRMLSILEALEANVRALRCTLELSVPGAT